MEFADPLLSALSERSERFLDMLDDGIERMRHMETQLEMQLADLQNELNVPIHDYNEPLVFRGGFVQRAPVIFPSRFRYWHDADSERTASSSASEENYYYNSPITQETHVRFDEDIRNIPPADFMRRISYTSTETVPNNYTPFYYPTNEDEDSDTETLVDFEWEDPYASPFSDDEDDYLTEAFH
jgi:hypothetical protein